jgi:hypothetical protein
LLSRDWNGPKHLPKLVVVGDVPRLFERFAPVFAGYPLGRIDGGTEHPSAPVSNPMSMPVGFLEGGKPRPLPLDPGYPVAKIPGPQPRGQAVLDANRLQRMANHCGVHPAREFEEFLANLIKSKGTSGSQSMGPAIRLPCPVGPQGIRLIEIKRRSVGQNLGVLGGRCHF